jgi:DNA-binding NarL/FixJ family response regulator
VEGNAPEPSRDIRVVIVDDHALLRAGTAQILRQAGGFEVVGEAGDSAEATRVFLDQRPDAVIVDIRLPDGNGIDLARRLIDACSSPKAAWPCRVLVLSAYDDPDYVSAAMEAGVAGYLLKTMPAADLVQAVRAACLGSTVLDPAVSRQLAPGGSTRLRTPPERERAEAGTANPGLALLTERERAVADLVAQGLQNKEVAQFLGISTRTVEGHLSRIFEKVGTRSRTALVRIAMSDSAQPRPGFQHENDTATRHGSGDSSKL